MFKLITGQEIREASKATIGPEHNYILDEKIIPEVCALLASECNRKDFDFKLRTEIFEVQPSQTCKLFSLTSPPLTPVSIRTTAFTWVLSDAGAGIYYAELVAGGNPNLANPAVVLENGVEMTRGVIATLSASQFAFGDADALNFRTIYVRLADSADPDSKDVGWVKAGPYIQVWHGESQLFETMTLLVKDVDYSIDTVQGVIESRSGVGFGPGSYLVPYWGGYVTADGQDVPPLLAGAARQQAKLYFDRREEFGISSRSVEGGSLSLLPLVLSPDIKKELKEFRLGTNFGQ